MNHARTVWPWMGAIALGFALGPACAPKAARRQTDIMAKTGAVTMSSAELRIRVNDLADQVSGRLEVTADRIRAGTRDRAIRRRALLFKADAVPVVFSAAYRTDPLVAAIDVWALALQISDYVGDGAGREAFGAQQPVAREGARQVLADADAVLERIAATPEAYARARAVLAAWVKQHPIEPPFSARPSAAAFWAETRFEERNAFAAVGAVTETIESVSERLNTYAAQMPRQARWQAEILVSEMSGEHDVEGTLGDIHAVGEAARRASDLLGEGPGAPGAVSSVRDLVGGERRALLDGVDRQRLQTLEYVTEERRAVLAALREERVAVVEALRQERIESLKEVDAIKTRAVDTALAGLRDLVDYTLWRVGLLAALLMVVAVALVVAGYWLTIGRHAAGSPA